ncbi:MAG: ABC transporter ATP-binding protein, partial [Lachnospiraceae bacterium]|nr:ABC transporter ATP-binding protein [Lachnospiraceae bacterium]
MRQKTLKRIGGILMPYLPYILLTLLCAVGTVFLTLEIPILTGRAIDCIGGFHQVDFDGLVAVLRTMTAVILLTALFQWLMNRINNYITYSVTMELRRAAFAKLQRLPVSHVDTHSH